jgi:hypothetical protein
MHLQVSTEAPEKAGGLYRRKPGEKFKIQIVMMPTVCYQPSIMTQERGHGKERFFSVVSFTLVQPAHHARRRYSP